MRRLLVLSLFAFLAGKAQAIDLTATGGVLRSVGRADLVAGAGSNLQSSYIDTAATVLDISGTSGAGDRWRIDVRRADTGWNAALTLQVRRDGDGAGGGSVSGGTAFIDVADANAEFFTGTGDRSGIPISYRLNGMGVKIPPGAGSTTIIFTVVDTP